MRVVRALRIIRFLESLRLLGTPDEARLGLTWTKIIEKVKQLPRRNSSLITRMTVLA